MITERFVSRTIYLAWSTALDQFEDNFIAICDYRPTENVDLSITQQLRDECRSLFDSMESEIYFIDEEDCINNAKVDYLSPMQKLELEQKLVVFTASLITITSKIKAFLADKLKQKTKAEKSSQIRISYLPIYMN